LQILGGAQNPYVSYEADAIDLYKLTGQRYDKFVIGDMVRIVDTADGINELFPIMEIEKSDLTGNPGAVSITIANKTRDLSGSITELQNRALINDLYAQGATNQVMVNFADNADTSNPAMMKLYVPDSMVRVNTCVLNFEFEPFRAYNRGISNQQQQTHTTSTSNTSVFTSSSTSQEVSTTSSTSAQSNTTSTSSVDTPTTSTLPTQAPPTTTEAQKVPVTSGGGADTPVSDAVTLLPQNIQDSSGGGLGSANHNHGIPAG
jgi:hypothetical protein